MPGKNIRFRLHPPRGISEMLQKKKYTIMILGLSILVKSPGLGLDNAFRAGRRNSVKRLSAHGVEKIVFAARENGADGHWYANFGYYAENEKRKCYRKMGRLCILDIKTGAVDVIVDDQGCNIDIAAAGMYKVIAAYSCCISVPHDHDHSKFRFGQFNTGSKGQCPSVGRMN